MTQIKNYLPTKEQVQAVQSTVDEINAKIVTPNYQVKTVTPSNVQQTVQADNGYTALWAVNVETIAAAMPENLEAFILNSSVEPFSLSLDGAVPNYACYNKTNLKRLYGNITSVGKYSFYNCSSLETLNSDSITMMESYCFAMCISLRTVNLPNLVSSSDDVFNSCRSLQVADLRKLEVSYIQLFRDCSSLRYVDIRKLKILYTNYFMGCSELRLIDSTELNSPISLQTVDAFTSTNDIWVLAVKDDNVKTQYQSATNWSTYASHIKTVAEVEAEVGMSYDEYYLQCFGHPRFY